MAADLWVDQDRVKDALASFFEEEKKEFADFGQTVNQTFEAFVFASVVAWYRRKGWRVALVHPRSTPAGTGASRQGVVKLKFSTRGRPSGYTYALCRRGRVAVEVRHNLRVATRNYEPGGYPPANVCLDVAVIRSGDLSELKTDDHVDNDSLVTFGEAKHMSAFAELLANFLGLVHEMLPDHLAERRPYIGPLPDRDHIAPFLYVSGFLLHTARGIHETIRRRGFDVDVYDHTSGSVFGLDLATRWVVRVRRRSARATAGHGDRRRTARKTGRRP